MTAQNRTFSQWFSTFRQSINSYGYYIDFRKVYENAERWKTEIYLLNSLVGSKDIETAFEALLAKYPDCIRAVPIWKICTTSPIWKTASLRLFSKTRKDWQARPFRPAMTHKEVSLCTCQTR